MLSSSLAWLVAAAVSLPNAVSLNLVKPAPLMIAEPELGNCAVPVKTKGVTMRNVAVPPITVLAKVKVIAVMLPLASVVIK